MEKYNHKKIEKLWQEKWREQNLYTTGENPDKPKYYILDMFPYPSGAGLHVGHPKGYIATDIFARMKTMQGFNVLHPMGWDAFGLPAENYALKNKVHPRIATEKNIATFKSQLEKLGFSYDWNREINTTDPKFYKWTQWIFLKLFEKGLAYESHEPINWCPSCQTGLANEDLEDGKCERCGSEIEQKPMRQWVLKITDYAERMLADLEKLPDWDESIKEQQKNWIGKSVGAEVEFKIAKGFEFKKIYFATGNKNKLERFERIFNKVYPDIKVEMVPELIKVEEDGKDVLENSLKKAKAYEGKYDVPVITDDTAIHFEGIDFEPTNVKRICLGGRSENEFSQEEIYDKILDFYKDLARKAGGEKDFYFEDGRTMIMPDGKIRQTRSVREYILTDKEHGEKMLQFPIRNLYKSKITGKYTIEHNENEFFQEFVPQIYALRDLIGDNIKVFTTRPDTLFGATYFVVAPEHPLIQNFQFSINNFQEVSEYIQKAKKKTTMERTELAKEKTGVLLEGVKVINPVNGEELPVFVADYVMMGYGTGAIMAVPAHDQRDFAFAQMQNAKIKSQNDNEKIKIIPVVDSSWVIRVGNSLEEAEEKQQEARRRILAGEECCVDDGIAINSGFLNGLTTTEAKEKMIAWLEEKGVGRKAVNYKIKDWVFSRQRYWGEPIPLVHCEKCGVVAVPEKDLPVELPEVEQYEPTGTGESPLTNITDWVNTACPKCGGSAKRETNTMPQWAGSSWYYLRYIDPDNDKALVDKSKDKYWSPVDFYVGGAEHATRHLIYARFWHKFLFDIGAVNYEEPFTRLQHVGLILAEDGRKMSKRWGNVINPDEIVEKYGADAMRVYEMFMGPFSQACAWSTNGLVGARKFLDKIYSQKSKVKNPMPTGRQEKSKSNSKIKNLLHKTIKKVGDDIQEFKLNTAVSSMMILANAISEVEEVEKEDFESFIKILAPFAPHFCEELWAGLGHSESIFKEAWPKYNPDLARDETIQLVVQINGKLRDTIEVSADITEDEAKAKAQNSEKIQKWLEGVQIVKVIFVKGRLVNIVVR